MKNGTKAKMKEPNKYNLSYAVHGERMAWVNASKRAEWCCLIPDKRGSEEEQNKMRRENSALGTNKSSKKMLRQT